MARPGRRDSASATVCARWPISISEVCAASIAAIPAAEWDACAGDINPTVSHAFLSICEESGSATQRTGWAPQHLTVTGPDKQSFFPGTAQTWGFDAKDDGSGVSDVRCSVVPMNTAPVFGPCTSAKEFVLNGAAEGFWTFSVRAADAAGNFAQQSRDIKIDGTPPETTIASSPDDGDATLNYPAAYAEVVSVAATDNTDARASFSNANSDVEIAAAGVNVLSTKRGGGYVAFSGTSMATPHVAGVAALIAAKNPTWTQSQIRAKLDTSVDDKGAAGRDPQFGFGRVNLVKAVS